MGDIEILPCELPLEKYSFHLYARLSDGGAPWARAEHITTHIFVCILSELAATIVFFKIKIIDNLNLDSLCKKL